MGAESEAKMAACKKICSPILAAICIVFEIIVFVFMVVAVPLDAFRVKKDSILYEQGSPRLCFSLWGPKECGPHRVNKNLTTPIFGDHRGFPSARIQHTIQAAEAFAILSIFFSLLCLILSGLLVCKCLLGFIPGIFGILNLICQAIVIGCVLGVFYKTTQVARLGPVRIIDHFTLHTTVALIIVSFCFQIFYLAIVFCV